MATSHLNPRSSYHARSNSLPSRPHPVIPKLDEHLCRLRSLEATSSTSSSASICHKLSGLQELHDCVDDMLLLPTTQQAFVQESNERWVDELLDGSLRLLDLCSIAKDALLQTKECAQKIQSIMRRRRGTEMELTSEIRNYMNSRRMIRKAIRRALKGKQSKSTEKNHDTFPMVSALREAEAVNLTIFESLLSYIAGHSLQTRSGSWSLVSKLVSPKIVASNYEENGSNELEKLDAALQILTDHKPNKSDYIMHVENVQNHLGRLESRIQDLEDGLECLFRRLVKTRVSLLNILNH
ncbi:hypothetical protein O6P43_002180 [Quillaja saponaria]|uniref:Uncharacterized protein n=1 Tax=Quillaja saponaria TaxID=32244 RepID=A0AAD7QBY2_QUISA|nr:hypothetical protein O6P43_002180 [Quillaja saponaria]KAJ7978688.1 hypothetical protein O6P43_002180 [Quillaja saponaria]